jgi:hypothetical protein
MHLMLARTALTFAFTAVLAQPNPDPAYRVVAQFESPRSIGTPLGDVARVYGGFGLADRIAGRLRLETDITLTEIARQLIREHLSQGS